MAVRTWMGVGSRTDPSVPTRAAWMPDGDDHATRYCPAPAATSGRRPPPGPTAIPAGSRTAPWPVTRAPTTASSSSHTTRVVPASTAAAGWAESAEAEPNTGSDTGYSGEMLSAGDALAGPATAQDPTMHRHAKATIHGYRRGTGPKIPPGRPPAEAFDAFSRAEGRLRQP